MASRAILARAALAGQACLRTPSCRRAVFEAAPRVSNSHLQKRLFSVTTRSQATVDESAGAGEGSAARPTEYAKLQSEQLGWDAQKIGRWEDFTVRHIGPRDTDIKEMLKVVGPATESLDGLIHEVVPKGVLSPPAKKITDMARTERDVTALFNKIVEKNKDEITWMNGGGYYQAETPAVIRRNILENPAWYTSYTPYQAEISQGRLESLLNFQTMVSDLTGLPIANASLLDEGTAAAEAMTMSLNAIPSSRAKRPTKTYVVSHLVHPRTIEVMHGRAEGFGIRIEVMDVAQSKDKIDSLGDDLVGVLVQYPDRIGGVSDYKGLADVVHKHGALLAAATDLSALTLLTPPGEWGADIALGNSQRFGIPLGFGGPHAAFMSVRESSKRRLPGRLVGVSKDRLGRNAMRLALQTREQHIRREKATSNVCTAQALLANMAAMYAIYHGPTGLKEIALENVRRARMIQAAADHYGIKVKTPTGSTGGQVISDTVTLELPSQNDSQRLAAKLKDENICAAYNISKGSTGELSLSVQTEAFRPEVFQSIVKAFSLFAGAESGNAANDVAKGLWQEHTGAAGEDIIQSIPADLRRTSSYLTHPVFNSYHSETEMLRYIHHLQSKDLSLVHAMIPLGSCTMKLNGTSQMELIGNSAASNLHPLAPADSVEGYRELFERFEKQLAALTGLDCTSLQPNSGAQGEFAGLRVIRKHHKANGQEKRDICLIPVSAHGTNPASAAMAGMRVVLIKCDPLTGNLDVQDLQAKCKKHADELAAIMITYPSTFGVFEPEVKKVCEIVHEHGGLVYMDGANMNAQIGLTTPGAIGADVCHLNLHKTFCIPHGGGGPGVGPICAKSFLEEYLPHKDGQTPNTSAPYGSASIVPISWAYVAMMGDHGLKKATQTAILNANYILARLRDHYPILYTNGNGRCAHEFIIDARPFKQSAGIEVADIAKRLQDYGFHAPTMSWPVPNTLMVEPTESESKEELDRFVDSMISIREEIREIEEGKQPREGNVLRNAPHPQIDLVKGDGEGKWDRPYSRERAAYPLPALMEKKFWPSVGRVDDTFGDTNLFCTCPPLEDYVMNEDEQADAKSS